ncbi:DUF1786 domain-containing protein [Methanoplanus endosymbiosus]|uniref:DUF1786 domain-containing protein n=1 Tax=Methanoplanus endosymbiosus TaxID=33865 RepID=A0A9E7PRS4_9EURY|nr:DUF1786 domain-containing protein [Methanoplanus endosymbiosus]UUX92407.1 DUF1786 domain-containing protein [Methanoplanus endosymbiosus]
MFDIDRDILSIDIGKGTQDILFFNPEKPVENSVKFVLPSPNVVVGREIMAAVKTGRPIHLKGFTMGGGNCVKAVTDAVNSGTEVTATEEAALTIRDNPDAVREKGIVITSDAPSDAIVIETRDFMEREIKGVFDSFSLEYPKNFAFAVQDHGFSPDMSNRLYRMNLFRGLLDEHDWSINSLTSDPPHPSMTRMQSVLKQAPGSLVTDTGPAAIMGALCDPVVKKMSESGLVLVNAGNGHTLVFTIKGSEIYGIFEHHTGRLSTSGLLKYIEELKRGTISGKEVFDDNGHGAEVRKPLLTDNIAVTGPNRLNLLPDAYQAAPYGDMMLSGCFGLLRFWEELRG